MVAAILALLSGTGRSVGPLSQVAANSPLAGVLPPGAVSGMTRCPAAADQTDSNLRALRVHEQHLEDDHGDDHETIPLTGTSLLFIHRFLI